MSQPREEHDGPTCPRHGVQYGALETCGLCAEDPGPLPTADIDEPLPPPPAGCMSMEDIERDFVNDARTIRDLITELRRNELSSDWHVANTIAKLFDARAKYLRAAAECARQREDEVIVKRREQRQREMRGAPH